MNYGKRLWFRFVSYLASLGNGIDPKVIEAFVNDAPVKEFILVIPPCPRGKAVRLPSGERAFVAIEINPPSLVRGAGFSPHISSDLFQDLKQQWTPLPLRERFRFSGQLFLSAREVRSFELGPLQFASLGFTYVERPRRPAKRRK